MRLKTQLSIEHVIPYRTSERTSIDEMNAWIGIGMK